MKKLMKKLFGTAKPKPMTKKDLLLKVSPCIRTCEKRKPHTIQVWSNGGYTTHTFI